MELSELPGVWRMRGYDRIFDISGDGITAYDMTEISCVASGIPFAEMVDRVERHGEDCFSLFGEGGITRYIFDRLPGLPDLCHDDKANDPEYNFEVFWRYFDEHYAFFELRGVDWDQVYQTYRPQVTQETTEEELFAIFEAIIRPFGDMHIGMEGMGKRISGAPPPALMVQATQEFETTDRMELLTKGLGKMASVISDDFLSGEGNVAANGMVIRGELEPNIGYLCVFAMAMYAGLEASETEHLDALTDVMDKVMEDFRDLDAVVVDMRFNFGGNDGASLLIANRFADRKRLAFSKKAVDGETFTETQSIYVQPEGAFQFTGPTYLLTSSNTLSAGEIFTLCMMPLPHVTRIGENTQGVLSDAIPRQLPNGWTVTLSEEVYTAADGRVYEGSGIPPHVHVPVFDAQDFYGGLKLAVDKAVSLIKART